MWITNFKLGRTGSEYQFADNPSQVEWYEDELKQEDRNLAGDKKRIVIKLIPQITLSYPNIDTAEKNRLISLKNDVSAKHNLLLDDELAIIGERRISASASVVTLLNTCRAGITIQGVWLASDTDHSGTNYFTGGGYNPTTREVTLGTTLPSTHEDVIIDYLYQGWYVSIMNITFSHSTEKPLVADATITLEGA